MKKENFLYTAEQISNMELFGPKNFITTYKITQNWAKDGLKFVRGSKKQMLFKLKWIDEYLEQKAEENRKVDTKVVNKNHKNYKEVK